MKKYVTIRFRGWLGNVFKGVEVVSEDDTSITVVMGLWTIAHNTYFKRDIEAIERIN